jgi:hypothetical protein
LQGDEVTCGYHGLVYNAQGRCVHMPSQETLNPSACVRSFPVLERHRFLWMWPGDPTKADPALIPDMHWNDDAEWAGDGKMIHVKCDYRLVVDNLMDLTHETFVHGSSIGNRAVAEAPFVATHGDRSATVTRWMENIDAPPFWAGQIKEARGYQGKVDRWQIIRFEAPCTVNIDVGVAEAGTGAPHSRAHGRMQRSSLPPSRHPLAIQPLAAIGAAIGQRGSARTVLVAVVPHARIHRAIPVAVGAKAVALIMLPFTTELGTITPFPLSFNPLIGISYPEIITRYCKST